MVRIQGLRAAHPEEDVLRLRHCAIMNYCYRCSCPPAGDRPGGAGSVGLRHSANVRPLIFFHAPRVKSGMLTGAEP